MNRDILTVVGCSGSLALMLFSANAAKASAEISLTQDSAQLAVEVTNTQGDRPLIPLGCICFSCQQIVRQMH